MKFGWKVTGVIGGIFAKLYTLIVFFITTTIISIDSSFFYMILKDFLITIIEGLILAYIFIAVYNKIPGKAIRIKSIIYSLLWAIPVIPINIFQQVDLVKAIIIPLGYGITYGIILGGLIKI